MQVSSEHVEICRETGLTVRVTVFAEVEAGGYGCAVESDSIAYECECQDHCTAYLRGTCPLND